MLNDNVIFHVIVTCENPSTEIATFILKIKNRNSAQSGSTRETEVKLSSDLSEEHKQAIIEDIQSESEREECSTVISAGGDCN